MLLKNYIEEYGDGGKTTPEDRQREAYDFFIGKGYTPAQASGIVGNLIQESGHNLNVNAIGDKNLGPGQEAYGIAQWRLTRKEDLKRVRPKDYDTFQGQLEFINWELDNTHKKAKEKVKSTNTAEEAAFWFGKEFERPKVVEAQRGKNAANLHTKFGGAEPSNYNYENWGKGTHGKNTQTLTKKDTNLQGIAETPTFAGTEGELAGLFADRDKPAPVVTGGEPEKIDFFNFAKIKELEDSRIEKEKSILQQMALQEQQEARQRQAQQQGEQQYEQPQGFNPYDYINIEEY